MTRSPIELFWTAKKRTTVLYYMLYIYGTIYFTATTKNRKLTFVSGYFCPLMRTFCPFRGAQYYNQRRNDMNYDLYWSCYTTIYFWFLGPFCPFLSMHWNSKLYYAEEQYEVKFILIKLYYIYFFYFWDLFWVDLGQSLAYLLSYLTELWFYTQFISTTLNRN